MTTERAFIDALRAIGVVLPAVNFDDKPQAVAGKVHDVMA